jgi:hypothetical protein
MKNTATGWGALRNNTTGESNAAAGWGALYVNTTGGSNTAMGAYALYFNDTGSDNIALGRDAGYYNQRGSYNIYIGHTAGGAGPEENNTIRIGMDGTQTRFFVAGVRGMSVAPAQLVGVTSDGQLGTVAAGPGSGLDADTVDGLHASAFMGSGVDNWVDATGDAMTGTLALNPVSGVGLSTTADVNLQGRVMRGSAPFIQADTSLANTAIGENALVANTTGSNNTATGVDALSSNSSGQWDTATGAGALLTNTAGNDNTAVGGEALHANITGMRNTAAGRYALYSNSTGDNNIAIGYRAGWNATTGDNNIYIGNLAPAAESNTTRIGTSSIQGRFFAAGITGVGVTGTQVVVDSNGQLGVVTSSRAFKDDVQDMAGASDGLLRLRPVSFRYKEADPSGDHPLQYGLIAEEVAEVYPELVDFSESGRPQSVKYHLLSSMLLNELQKQRRQLEAQETEIRELRAQKSKIRDLEARLAGLEAALAEGR